MRNEPNQIQLGNWISEYIDFLKNDFKEPSIEVDFIWHAHMQDSERYGKECLFIANRFIDHIS